MKLHDSVNKFEESEKLHEASNEPTYGIVSCEFLNVRESPSRDSYVLAILNRGTKVAIDFQKSNEDFYSICTEYGIEGYCMKQYIEA